MAVSTPPALVRLTRRLARLDPVERIVLFGSRARGDHGQFSDIDLAIAAPGADEIEWDRILEAVETADTLLTVDVVRMEEAPAALLGRITEEGVVLFARNESEAVGRGIAKGGETARRGPRPARRHAATR